MQADFAQKLKRVLSTERLEAYQLQLDGNGNRNLFSHYAWNMALSESLYSTLQLLEIGLRNSLDQAASAYFAKANWFEDNAIIQSRDQATVSKAKKMLLNKNKKLEPGRIIAELNFGFWTSLLDTRYEQTLWPALIKTSFPHMPRKMRTRKNLSRRSTKSAFCVTGFFIMNPSGIGRIWLNSMMQSWKRFAGLNRPCGIWPGRLIAFRKFTIMD